MVRNIFNKVKVLRENSVFQGNRKLFKNLEQWKIFSIHYIQCIFTWGDPCNLG